MTPRSCAATVSLLGAVLGCSASKEPTGSLISISPNVAYNDVPLEGVEITAKNLRPAYTFDTMAGGTAAGAGDYSVTLRPIAGDTSPTQDPVQLQGVKWSSPALLSGTIPAGVQAGAYDVVVTDPRGQETTLHQAFTSLGPDEVAPVLTLDFPAPGSLLGALTTMMAEVSADDGQGFVESPQVTISPPPKDDPMIVCRGTPHKRTCNVQFLAPTPSRQDDVVTIQATARDSLGNEAPPQSWSFPLAPRPVVISMSPTAGPTGGGTEIVLQGSDFVSGSALLIDGLKIENPYISATEIRGVTQRHDPGPAMVQVLNGTALSAPRRFDFVAAPSVKLVSPARGPLAGGTWMAVVGNYFREGETTIRIGGVLLEDPCFVSVNRIEGRLPAGAAAGAVEVTADDPIGGAGTRSVTFTYDAAETTELDPLGGDLQMLCPGVQ